MHGNTVHPAAGNRQFDDMILLAHIRARFSLSRQSYGSARIYVQLCDDGIAVGRHRVARLMRENDKLLLEGTPENTLQAHNG